MKAFTLAARSEFIPFCFHFPAVSPSPTSTCAGTTWRGTHTSARGGWSTGTCNVKTYDLSLVFLTVCHTVCRNNMLQISTNEERFVWPPFGETKKSGPLKRTSYSIIKSHWTYAGYGIHQNFETIGCIAEGSCYDRATTHFKRVGIIKLCKRLAGFKINQLSIFLLSRASPTGPRPSRSPAWPSASTRAGTKRVRNCLEGRGRRNVSPS